MRRIATSLLLIVMLSGCGHVVMHPGAPNKQASVAFDVLLTAKGVIDEGRIQLAKGALPVAAKAPLNDLIKAYTVATASLKTYSDVATSNGTLGPSFNLLNADLMKVKAAILAFKKVRP